MLPLPLRAQRCFVVLLLALLSLLSLALLSGCSNREVKSTVQSYSSLSTPLADTRYRLELLPSQEDDAGRFAAVLEKAQQALFDVGLQRDEEHAHWVVQVSASSDRFNDSPWPGYGYGGYYNAYSPWWGYAPYGFGPAWGPFYWDPPPSRLVFLRRVRLLLRDAQSGKLVYETGAEGRSSLSNDLSVFAVLFRAALSDFPNASSEHLVRLPLHGKPASAL